MNNPSYKAKIKADGREVTVYKTKRDTYCELPLCKVEHEKGAVQIINEIFDAKK